MAVHAAGETGPAPADTIAVVLQVADEAELLAAAAELQDHHVLIREPDPPYLGAAMAIGCLRAQGRPKVFTRLRLWRPP